MTEEEIKQKAEEWYKNTVKINEWKKGVLTTYMPNATTGFIAGVKLMQKENEQLKAQIGKMKCLFDELVIALSTMKNGEKYNVSLLADARKLLEELKE